MTFRAFRLVVGAILITLALWLIVEGGQALAPRLSSSQAVSGSVAGPVLRIVAGVLLIGIYYWSLWSASGIHRSLENIFSIPELIRKLAFTLGLLCIYRIGFHVWLPGVDQEKVISFMSQQQSGIFRKFLIE